MAQRRCVDRRKEAAGAELVQDDPGPLREVRRVEIIEMGDEFVVGRVRGGGPMMVAPPCGFGDQGQEDLQELGAFYEHTSGGLMLNALDLTPEKVNCNDLSREFGRLGLTRLRRLFTLKRGGHLKAVLVANVSNVGLNLSDFTNCVKLFVLDPEDMGPDIVNATIACIADITTKDNFPLLMYPVTVADDLGIAYPKKYALWVCSLHVSDEYFKYLKRLLRFI